MEFLRIKDMTTGEYRFIDKITSFDSVLEKNSKGMTMINGRYVTDATYEKYNITVTYEALLDAEKSFILQSIKDKEFYCLFFDNRTGEFVEGTFFLSPPYSSVNPKMGRIYDIAPILWDSLSFTATETKGRVLI